MSCATKQGCKARRDGIFTRETGEDTIRGRRRSREKGERGSEFLPEASLPEQVQQTTFSCTFLHETPKATHLPPRISLRCEGGGWGTYTCAYDGEIPPWRPPVLPLLSSSSSSSRRESWTRTCRFYQDLPYLPMPSVNLTHLFPQPGDRSPTMPEKPPTLPGLCALLFEASSVALFSERRGEEGRCIGRERAHSSAALTVRCWLVFIARQRAAFVFFPSLRPSFWSWGEAGQGSSISSRQPLLRVAPGDGLECRRRHTGSAGYGGPCQCAVRAVLLQCCCAHTHTILASLHERERACGHLEYGTVGW